MGPGDSIGDVYPCHAVSNSHGRTSSRTTFACERGDFQSCPRSRSRNAAMCRPPEDRAPRLAVDPGPFYRLCCGRVVRTPGGFRVPAPPGQGFHNAMAIRARFLDRRCFRRSSRAFRWNQSSAESQRPASKERSNRSFAGIQGYPRVCQRRPSGNLPLKRSFRSDVMHPPHASRLKD